ncbi:hypothetical protein KDK88_06505 [bacterium]|nr:hypothetical protein [bacterium]HPF34071.1 hypothetical protein [Candidatus Krumholzibacteria bacterium]HRX52417.1 hypothetical protein [Candidatus Krumholzibacteria bacterium]
MLHRGRILTIALMLFVAGAAQAGVSVLGGVTLPQANWGDLAKPGPHVGVEITVPMIPSLLSVGGEALLSRNVLDIEALPYSVPEGNTARWYTGEAMGVAKLQLPLTGLHAKAAFGVITYRYEAEGEGWFDIPDQTRIVGAVGAGLSVSSLEIQAMYHVVKWDEDADYPESLDEVDTNFSFFTVSAAFGL